jgi:hypothetical protein
MTITLGLLVALGALAMPAPAQASPISAHAMVHSCCTPSPMKERIFAEAKSVGASYIRVDVELDAIFGDVGGAKRDEADWSGLDEVVALSRRHRLPVLGILLAPPGYVSSCPERWPDTRLCPVADTEEYGRLAGEVAKHAAPAISHWEIGNEPDADWAFEGTPEDYAAMLSAAHDGIKEQAPGAKVVLGGLANPTTRGWLDRVFAAPGADAIHKFDIASAHLRGPTGMVVHRYLEFRAELAARRFRGPVWVTEHGYSADPAYQVDPLFKGGDTAQASYLTHSLVGLAEAGAPQVFVTLRDNEELSADYANEGLVRIDESSGETTARRPAFAAVRRLARNWDQIIGWRREQREHERAAREYKADAATSAAQARAWRPLYRTARLRVHSLQDALARRRPWLGPRRRAAVRGRLERRLFSARAVLAGRRAGLLWHGAFARHWRERAKQEEFIAYALGRKVAGT